jgi:hypothetical protein
MVGKPRFLMSDDIRRRSGFVQALLAPGNRTDEPVDRIVWAREWERFGTQVCLNRQIGTILPRVRLIDLSILLLIILDLVDGAGTGGGLPLRIESK